MNLTNFGERINRDQMREIMNKFNAAYLDEDITATGDGSDFY